MIRFEPCAPRRRLRERQNRKLAFGLTLRCGPRAHSRLYDQRIHPIPRRRTSRHARAAQRAYADWMRKVRIAVASGSLVLELAALLMFARGCTDDTSNPQPPTPDAAPRADAFEASHESLDSGADTFVADASVPDDAEAI